MATALKTKNVTLTNRDLAPDNKGDNKLAKELMNSTALTTLYLDESKITDVGAAALAALLETSTALTTLHLSGNEITDPGATALATALKTKTITLTNLGLARGNIITDVGGCRP